MWAANFTLHKSKLMGIENIINNAENIEEGFLLWIVEIVAKILFYVFKFYFKKHLTIFSG